MKTSILFPIKHMFSNYWDGFLHLLFPSKCLICEVELVRSEVACCSICMSELPFTQHELETEPSEMDKLFWGRIRLESTYALMYYSKNNSSKEILHALKYSNRPEIGRIMGEMVGRRILKHEKYSSIEVLIPVPLHYKKRFIRGYNQSEQIAIGISKGSSIPVDCSVLKRRQHTQSQTRLGRFKRWDNVEGLFFVEGDILRYKHIALVDDVVTTGSTLESIMISIRRIAPTIQISVISLAVAK